MTKHYLVAAVLLGLVSTVALVIQAVALGRIVQDVLIDHRAPVSVVPSLWVLIGAFALRASCVWAGSLAAHRTSAEVTSALRRQVIDRVVIRGPAWLSGARTGELTALLTQGIDALDLYFARYLPTAVLAALAPVALLAWIAVDDWFTAVILTATVAVIPLFMILLGLEATRQADRQWRRLAGLSATFYDLLQGLATLRAFGRTRDGRATLAQANDELHAETMSTLKVAFLSSLALETLAAVGTALVALFLGLRLLHGSLDIATALALLVLAPEIYLPLRRAGAEFHAAASGRAAAEELLDLLDGADTVPAWGAEQGASCPASPSSNDVPSARETIRFEGITVRYPGRHLAVLDGVEWTIEPGRHLAVVGESGTGKSTLLSLLLGFLTPDEGVLTVGGQPLGATTVAAWRQQIAWVPQRPFLVRATLEENLRLGAPRASASKVAEALERAGLDEMVAQLPRGLATPVGEGGVTLSAGERQRIALARAILRDTPLVLLDEPTAHLDERTEDILADRLAGWFAGRTVIMAAHRGGLVRALDETVTLLDGHLVACASMEATR